ncbi:polysaccharide export protein [Ochrobactrum sp. SD129]|nr:polysaccharide export protein [Ochrobactrum sp. SD129]
MKALSAGGGLVVLVLGLSGCGSVPTDGPLKSDVIADATKDIKSNSFVYDVVDVDLNIANFVASYKPVALEKMFGFGGPASTPVIGVGDGLGINIFEAGPDGLFSSAEQKQVVLNVVVQPDGYASIPYVGPFKFAGKTLETARRGIKAALEGKAVEPDVIITLAGNSSRTVSINGSVANASVVSLGLQGEQLTEVIAKAGGPTKAPYDSYVALTRGKSTSKVLFQTLIDNPRENIYVKPGDQIFVAYEPQSFTALGSVGKVGQSQFNAANLTLIEAAALAGGSDGNLADPQGYFVFRYEEERIARMVLGENRFNHSIKRGMYPNRDGKYPIVYRIDMTKPQSYLLGQTFPINNKDVVYLSRHPATDLLKFLRLVSTPLGVARSASAF